MARCIRIQAAGAYDPVMARGNRRESIFHDDDDRRFFLHTLGQACERTGWRVQAWVFMGSKRHAERRLKSLVTLRSSLESDDLDE